MANHNNSSQLKGTAASAAGSLTGLAGCGGGSIGMNGSGAIDNSITTIKGKLVLDSTDADVVVNGRSLSSQIDKINERLLILEPDPKLLEKYESLTEAYNHYKTLEALLTDNNNDS